jgi:LmbE family N-acetylglucosaminyl deacetylase
LLDYRDGTLSDVEDEEGAHRVLAAVQEIRPQVLLTWPPDGLSGHADHMAVSRWTSLAFQRADSPAPLALYYLAVPRSLAQALGLSHLHAVADEEVSLSVDVAAVREHKLAAIHCHRSQVNSSPILSAPEEKQRLFLGTEHFRLAADRPSEMGKNVLQSLVQSLEGVHP